MSGDNYKYLNRKTNTFIKMKKSLIVLAVLLVMPLFLISSASALFMGITDGYVKDNTGSLVNGANVSVTVTGCSGNNNGCTGSALSQSNGYYIVNNLNLPKSGGVNVSAFKVVGVTTGTGSAGGTADSFQIAHVNVSICFPPSSPSLTDVPNGDEPNITFSWTSGTDPNLQPQHDKLRLDSVETDNPATSPIFKPGLSFITHTWDVATCNAACCSNWATDTFTITCPAPTSPTLVAVPDSHSTSATLSWTSGADPHGRTAWDKSDFDGGSLIDPATSPINKIGLSFASHTWRAATCNIYCCSSWASDGFTTGNQAPSAPNMTNHTVSGTTTSLNWTSGVDPEGDPTYDEFQYKNGSIVSLVTAPFDVTTELLIRWAVRTCDNFNACSNWTWTDSVTCGNVTTSCATCPVCEEGGGGGGGGSTGQKWTGGGVGCRKVAMTCNGIPMGEDILLSLNLQLGPNGKKITIKGLNITLENLEYCPWCYNGKKDYDETGLDCGGSCGACEISGPMPVNAGVSGIVIALLALSIALAIGSYLSYRFNWAKRLSKFLKKK